MIVVCDTNVFVRETHLLRKKGGQTLVRLLRATQSQLLIPGILCREYVEQTLEAAKEERATVDKAFSVLETLIGLRYDRPLPGDESVKQGAVERLRALEPLTLADPLSQEILALAGSYWIYVHAHRDEISIAALAVEKVIAAHEEYAIYRVLVGFEGIFGDWSTLKKSRDQIEAIEKDRRQKASDFAGAITGANYDEWRTRILAYGTRDSDDLATFPVFYHFLSEFATARPELALRLITEDTKAVALFLIPILVSLWDGPYRNATRALIEKWINDAQHGQQH